MEVIPPSNMEHSGDLPESTTEQAANEALFSTILERVGLDTVVGALHQRKRVKEQKLEGSIIDHPQTHIQFNVHADGVDFVMPGPGGGIDWHGSLGYDDARHIVSMYIDEQLRVPEEPAQ